MGGKHSQHFVKSNLDRSKSQYIREMISLMLKHKDQFDAEISALDNCTIKLKPETLTGSDYTVDIRRKDKITSCSIFTLGYYKDGIFTYHEPVMRDDLFRKVVQGFRSEDEEPNPDIYYLFADHIKTKHSFIIPFFLWLFADDAWNLVMSPPRLGIVTCALVASRKKSNTDRRAIIKEILAINSKHGKGASMDAGLRFATPSIYK